MSPYRTPATEEPVAVEAEAEEPCPDADLLPVLLVLWIGSAARVMLCFVQSTRFDTEACLAAIAVVLVPYLAREGMAWTIRRVVRRLL